MKSDFMIALTQLAAERNLPKEVILKTVEAALVSAFKKDSFGEDQEVSVRIAPQSGDVRVYVQKTVVEDVEDSSCEIVFADARKIKKDIQIGELIEVESTPKNAGRIAAQTAKQVVMQRLREAERDAIYGEYATREGELVSGVVQRVEGRDIIINLGQAEAILPLEEQVSTERYRPGQRLKVFLKEVLRSGRGPQLVVSRSHPGLLKHLLELEIPEMHTGAIELKAIAREGGQRSKIAVAARQDRVDPVGCCVGLRGIRIQNVTKELNGEKIDITQWDSSPAVFVANALSPATVMKVDVDEDERTATVIVPDKQFSLAIGKEGQNARLAAKLTGWRIDIKSSSTAEAELKKAAPEEEVESVLEEIESEIELPVAEESEPLVKIEDQEIEIPSADEGEIEVDTEVEAEPETEEESDIEIEIEEEQQPEVQQPVAEAPKQPPKPAAPLSSQSEPSAITDDIFSIIDKSVERVSQTSGANSSKSQLRFAEDLGYRQFRPDSKQKKGKKKEVAKQQSTLPGSTEDLDD
ncbi:MAG: transcription termination factor NusA [Chloroflexota bacterium]|nr:transcription termination factor NusA [Chloroflexota bacterium]